MLTQPRQLLLDLGEEPLWDRLPEDPRRQILALLEQMIAEIWMDRSGEEESGEREDHLHAS